jgi:hypothetical protein
VLGRTDDSIKARYRILMRQSQDDSRECATAAAAASVKAPEFSLPTPTACASGAPQHAGSPVAAMATQTFAPPPVDASTMAAAAEAITAGADWSELLLMSDSDVVMALGMASDDKAAYGSSGSDGGFGNGATSVNGDCAITAAATDRTMAAAAAAPSSLQQVSADDFTFQVLPPQAALNASTQQQQQQHLYYGLHLH